MTDKARLRNNERDFHGGRESGETLLHLGPLSHDTAQEARTLPTGNVALAAPVPEDRLLLY